MHALRILAPVRLTLVRSVAGHGWIRIAAILVDATSDFLGRKSSDLFLMTACVIAMSGYPRTAPAARLASHQQPLGRSRTVEPPSLRPSPMKPVGFRS